MRFLIFTVLIIMCSYSVADISVCRNYTDEQRDVINSAYSFGLPYNYGHTLAAIVVKESFVGDRIIRYNPNDPSTGITHIQFNTLKDLSGLDHWSAIEESENLINDDFRSFHYSIKKLDSIKGSFWYKWKRYNGNGEKAEKYARHIQGIIKSLKECDVIDGSNFS